MTSTTELHAELAKRVEDARIARKHMEEAGARTCTPENVKAYQRACDWSDECAQRERVARAACIRASLAA